jgi:hypothetical protein
VTFGRRLVVLAAIAVAVAVLVASGVTYAVVRHDLRARVDRELDALTADVVERTEAASGGNDAKLGTEPGVKPVLPPQGRLEDSSGYAQFV